VFARAPLAGRVKTRLVPRLGAERATGLHRQLILKAVCTAQGARCGPVELHITRRHAFFRTLDVPLRLQCGQNLGERMYRALRTALQRHRSAILIGADCPSLTPADLRRAARLLQAGVDVVLAPAEDGGYALIGARRVSPGVFANVEWGSADVLPRTMANLAGARLSHRLLRTVWDVDRPEDLERLRARRFSLAARRGAPR
jgi:rSAM/selenodomain-associated transferase 1